MQIRSIILLQLLCCTWLLSCKKEALVTYNLPGNIYFSLADASAGATDSSRVTFSYNLEEVTDSLFKISISATGMASGSNRSFKIVAGNTSTAVAGTHYKALDNMYTFHAGKVKDTVAIQLYRTSDLRSKPVYLDLQLLPSDDFETNMQRKIVSGGSISFVNYRIILDDLISRPPKWPYFWGKFSPKKFFLLCDLGGFQPVMLSSDALYDDYMARNAAALAERYLAEQKAAGTTVLYEDGTEMRIAD